MAVASLTVVSSFGLYASRPNLQHSTSGILIEDPPREDDWDRLSVMVLNLDARPDRLRRLAATLADSETGAGTKMPFSHGQVCRIPAVNTSAVGNDLVGTGVIDAEVWQRAVDVSIHHNQVTSTELSRGSVGCFLSHALAWKRMVDLSLPAALILEDDTSVLSPVMRRRFQSFSSDLPADWKMVQLNGCFRYHGDRQWWWGAPWGPAAGLHATNRSVPVDLNSCNRATGDGKERCPQCQGAYLLSLEGAKYMLKNSFPMTLQFDSSPAFAGLPGHYYSDPPLAMQFASDDSDDQAYVSDTPFDLELQRSRDEQTATDVSDRGGIVDCAESPKSTSTSEYLMQAFSAYVTTGPAR